MTVPNCMACGESLRSVYASDVVVVREERRGVPKVIGFVHASCVEDMPPGGKLGLAVYRV